MSCWSIFRMIRGRGRYLYLIAPPIRWYEVFCAPLVHFYKWYEMFFPLLVYSQNDMRSFSRLTDPQPRWYEIIFIPCYSIAKLIRVFHTSIVWCKDDMRSFMTCWFTIEMIWNLSFLTTPSPEWYRIFLHSTTLSLGWYEVILMPHWSIAMMICSLPYPVDPLPRWYEVSFVSRWSIARMI